MKKFEKYFIKFGEYLINKKPKLIKDIISIDGKSLRGSRRSQINKSALHVVNAWSDKHSIVLGQKSVDSKSNEIVAIPELLDVLESGVPIMSIANSMQIGGVMKGLHTIDVGMLASPVIIEFIQLIGDSNDVDYRSGLDDMMIDGFREVKKEYSQMRNPDFRTAAYKVAIEKIAMSYDSIGL